MATDDPLLKTLPLEFFDSLYHSVVITTGTLDGDHPKILYVNRAFTEMTGYAPEEVIGKKPCLLRDKKVQSALLEQLREEIQDQKCFEGEIFNYRKNGTKYRLRWMVEPLRDSEGETIGYISFQKDITSEYALMQHRKLFQKAIDQSSVHIALFDEHSRFIYANGAYVERTGYTLEELMGARPALLRSGVHDEAFYQHIHEQLKAGVSHTGLFSNLNARGEIYYEKQTISPIREGGETVGYVVFGKGVDNEIREHNMLLNETMTDALTGVLNRKALTLELEQAAEAFHTSDEHFCILFADLNDFKIVNDTYGHDIGDSVLRSVAAVLSSSLRKSDRVIRYGGDEFICILRAVGAPQATIIAAKLRERITEHPEHRKYGVGISIGVSEYHGESVELLIRHADREMYRTKEAVKSDPSDPD
jgi:diguanylate cyclase (GGDEF)-like protein/PAS domain S-box-containing protein